MKFFTLLFILISETAICIAQPAISSFAPVSGPVGTTVTINGNNFSSTPSNNNVFFGAVKAPVISASFSSLTVTVPAGATYKPITVTTGGLTAYSSKPFFVSFPGAGSAVNYYSFDTTIKAITDLHPNGIAISDLDGDGKPDIATPNNYSTSGSPASFSVMLNTSQAGNISFAPKTDFSNGVATYAIAAGDIDGDGKPDIVVSSIADNSISVFRNTSVPGNISFASKVDFATNSTPFCIAIRDLDRDGRPDLAVANYMAGNVTVYKNTGTIGVIGFAAAINITTGLGPLSVVAGDINGDGKPDLVVANELSNSVSVFRNLSVTGTLSFAPKTDFATDAGPRSVAVGDLDNDGKWDMVVTGGSSLGTFRNLSTSGNISFGPNIQGYTGLDARYVTIADLNGDAKPDVLVTSNIPSVHLNVSTPGSLALAGAEFLGIASGSLTSFVTEAGDLNADSKPDLISAVFNADKVYINRNKVNETYISSFNPAEAPIGATVNISGGYFTGATAVNFGGLAASSFSVYNDQTITAVVGAGNSGSVSVTSPNGTASFAGFTIAAPPVITNISPLSAGYGQVVTLTGNYFSNVTSVSFGGTAASFTVVSPTTIQAVVAMGSSGNVTVTTSYGTGSFPGFTYLPIPVISSFTPTEAGQGGTVTITGSNFTGTTAVSFGGVAATSFNVVSASSITAVPGNGSSGSISITNAFGTSNKSGFVFIPAPIISSFSPTTGIAGTVITVTGSGFTNISAVTVGGVSYTYSYTSLSPTSITIPINAQGASGAIAITTPGGTATKPGFIFYKTPECYSISPALANTGMQVTLTGANFDAVSEVTLGGAPVASYTVLSPNTIQAIVGSGNSGPVYVTNPAGTNYSHPQFVYSNSPVVTSIAPLSGPVGSLVTIRGGGFSAAAANNNVLFGTVKANIVSATANTLTVKVPNGAPLQRISVINNSNNSAAITDFSFSLTFPADTVAFNAGSFAGKFTIPTGPNLSANVVGDLDADGRQDIVVSYFNSSFITVYRNTSTSGILSFAPGVNIPVDSRVTKVLLADIDNDGKPDIICNNGDWSGAGVLIGIKNNSSTGSLSFGTYFTIYGYEANTITTGDFNSDGRVDIATACFGCSSGGSGNLVMKINIFLNSSVPGNISFVGPYSPNSGSINTNGNVFMRDITARDMNNDGKPDIILGTSGDFLVVFKNIGNGSYGFSPIIVGSFNYANYPKQFAAIADLNLDGLPDIVTQHHIHKNLGNFNFETSFKADIGMASAMCDLDGDGRIDFIKTNGYIDSAVYLNKNNSTVSNISFAPPSISPAPAAYKSPQVADLDGDNRPEIIYINYGSDSISILKNRTGADVLCPGGSTVFYSSIQTATSYQWQVNTGTGFANIIPGANYSGSNTAALQLNNIPSSWYGYQYRCVADGQNSTIQKLQFFNTYTGAAGTAWENPANWSCGVLPDSNTDVLITSGTITLGTNTTIRSLMLIPGVNLTVTPGTILTILH